MVLLLMTCSLPDTRNIAQNGAGIKRIIPFPNVYVQPVARGLWRMANSPPALPDGMRPWERRLARALHLGLYVLILAMIASGWLMVSASQLPITSSAGLHRAQPDR